MVQAISVEQYLTWSYNFIDKHLYDHASQMAESTHLPKELVTKAMCGGKRFRPMLVFLSTQACGGRPENAIPLAVSIEFIHESSLMHDDVQDEDLTRRGVPTFNNMMGNKLAIAMGDAGMAHSIETIKNMGSDLITMTATAISTLATGFIRESIDRTFDSEHPILEIIGMKTAILFSTACVYGAKAAGTPRFEDILRGYGKNLGMGFQIADDFCALLEGLEGGNFSDGITLPLFCFYVQEPSLRDPITKFGQGELEFSDIKDRLEKDKRGLFLAKRKLLEYNNKAVFYAKQMPKSPFKDILCQLPSFVVSKMILEGGSGVVSRWNAIPG